MSHTLNKLKQSEVDHGLRKPTEKRSKSPQGLFIALFIMTLGCLLAIISFRDVIFSEQRPVSSTTIIASSSKTKATDPPVRKQIKTKVEEKNIDTKEQKIEILKTDIADLIDQEKNSFPFDPELLGILEFKKRKKDNRVTKEELVINLPERSISTNKKQPELEKTQNKTWVNNKTEVQNEGKKMGRKDQKVEIAIIDNTDLLNQKTAFKDFPEKKVSNNENQLSSKPEDQLQLWKNLSTQFKESMPEMELNGITFFEKEKDRYIIINMNKYQLDDIVENGPSIDEIRKDSVIMFYKNKQFILPLGQ